MAEYSCLARSPLFADAAEKAKRGNQILFSRESLCLQPLLQAFRQENRRTLVLWALTCVQTPAAILRKQYPADPRPQQAVELASAWAAGSIKMPLAKQGILAVHAMAKELSSTADAALCHAVGQGCSAVHTEGHAIGLALYELTAIVHSCSEEECIPALDARIAAYEDALPRCRVEAEDPARLWAPFLCKENGRQNAELRRLAQEKA